MIPPSRIIRLARQIRARSFEVDFNVKRESPSQTYKLYQPPERPTLTAHRAVGIARRVGGRPRAKRDSYRPRLTHSSWVNIYGGWDDTRHWLLTALGGEGPIGNKNVSGPGWARPPTTSPGFARKVPSYRACPMITKG